LLTVLATVSYLTEEGLVRWLDGSDRIVLSEEARVPWDRQVA
jgi:hypothetical protein